MSTYEKFGGQKAPGDIENPNVVIKDEKDRPAEGMHDSPIKPEEAFENIEDEQKHSEFFEEKYKQNHQAEFRTPESRTEEQVYDPIDEMDAKIDMEMKEDIGPDELIGPESEFPRPRFIPNEEWAKLSRDERIKIYNTREAGKKLEESYVKHTVKRFVRKIFGKKTAA